MVSVSFSDCRPFSSSTICYGNGETNIEEREKEAHKWSLNCSPLLPHSPDARTKSHKEKVKDKDKDNVKDKVKDKAKDKVKDKQDARTKSDKDKVKDKDIPQIS